MNAPAEPTCAVVVNWNGWRDTLVCLESLFALRDGPLQIVVCDNASADGSVARIAQWLHDRVPVAGEDPVVATHLLALDENLGYAGGLNAGIRWAQQHWRPRRFWLLNNDVQALPGALRALLDAHAQVPGAGLCGSILLDWDRPDEVQAVGGMYRRWLGVGWHETRLPASGASVCLDIDYPVGASLLADREYLERVGLMDASYFLYYEEMDWVERGRRAGYRPVVALGSRLRHKEGASTGSRGGVRHKSLLSERHGVVNRLRITRRFWPAYLPLVWGSLWLVIADRLAHREFGRAALVLRLMFSPRQWLR
jgi:GT2 family glycosyltransferase